MLHQMLVQFYYPAEFQLLDTLHATTALNVINTKNKIKLNYNEKSKLRLAPWHSVILYFNVNKHSMYVSLSVKKGKKHGKTLTKKSSLFENNSIKQTTDGN